MISTNILVRNEAIDMNNYLGDIYFLCSSLRGNGYQLTRLQGDNFEQISKYPGKVIAEYMSQRGADLFLARENNMHYLAIKHIKSKIVRHDASGAEIYITILICSSNEKSIRALCCEVYRNYSGFATALYNAYNDNDNLYDVGYSFNNAEIKDYLNSIIEKNINEVSLSNRLPRLTFQHFKKSQEVIEHLRHSMMPKGNDLVLFIAELTINASQLKERFSVTPLIEISSNFRTEEWPWSYPPQDKKKTNNIEPPNTIPFIVFFLALIIIIILVVINLRNQINIESRSDNTCIVTTVVHIHPQKQIFH